MKAWTLPIGIAVACGVGGFALGRVSSARAQPKATPTAAKQASTRMPALSRGLLCASRASAPNDPECGAEQLRTTWCEAQLQECEAGREAVRQAWPEEGTVEDPEAWSAAVEGALAECDIEGADIELIECTEYPCVAAFRPQVEGGPRDEGFMKEQERLINAVRACAPLREAFGSTNDKALDVFANDTTCPDGSRRDFFALMALAEGGPAHALVEKDENRTPREERDVFRWLFRRGDDVAAQYPCE